MNETTIFSHTATSTHFKLNSKLYMTASLSLEESAVKILTQHNFQLKAVQMSFLLMVLWVIKRQWMKKFISLVRHLQIQLQHLLHFIAQTS